MSVYTPLSSDFFSSLVEQYKLSKLIAIQGIKAGVTNTLYYLNTEAGEFILTLFESLDQKALQDYVELMRFFKNSGLNTQCPIPDRHQQIIHQYQTKPYLLTPYLPGETIVHTNPVHCQQLGALLGQMHNIGTRFQKKMPNPRGIDWCFKRYQSIQKKLTLPQQRLIESELKRQVREDYSGLPQGIIHADLFRDNVLFTGKQLSGVIDFYYACWDYLLIDLAVIINDWCLNQKRPSELIQTFLSSYQRIRSLDKQTLAALQAILCRVSLRFYLSRLSDHYQHEESALVQIKDPKIYEDLLLLHRNKSVLQ